MHHLNVVGCEEASSNTSLTSVIRTNLAASQLTSKRQRKHMKECDGTTQVLLKYHIIASNNVTVNYE